MFSKARVVIPMGFLRAILPVNNEWGLCRRDGLVLTDGEEWEAEILPEETNTPAN